MEKDIKGYEGLYTIDDKGQVFSLITHKYLKAAKCGSGYLKVMLCKDKKHTNVMIHRLVAEAFIPNPDGKLTVNHIDGDKTNNDISNLEWNTYSENLKHAYVHGFSRWNEKKGKPMRAVYKIDKDTGKILKRYRCIGDAVRDTNAYHYSAIIDACKGKNQTCAGFKWRYADDN